MQNKESSVSVIPVQKRKRMAFLMKDVGAWVLMIPTLLILYFWIIRPIVSGILYSFCEMQGFESLGWAGFNNYKAILKDTRFVQILINTFKYVIWGMIIGYLPPIIVAIMINEMVHWKGFFKFSMYFPCMISGVACSLIWYYMYLQKHIMPESYPVIAIRFLG